MSKELKTLMLIRSEKLILGVLSVRTLRVSIMEIGDYVWENDKEMYLQIWHWLSLFLLYLHKK